MSRPWLAVLAVLALLACGAARAADPAPQPEPGPEPWPERLSNPQPAEGDLVLPMPCGGAMAFRRVDIPAGGVLGDRRVQLGGADADLAYAEGIRADYVGGGFSDPLRQGLGSYYIGKYEVTRAQLGAFDTPCRKPGGEGRLPAVAVTWAEAVAFAARYSAWLAVHAPDALPREAGAPGFLRLPTEAEWEYAARGGAAVADAVFVERTYPMPEGIGRHAWHQGTQSANNELNAIGLLQPNPLGLHDVLGNAGEFVLEPFRLNKLSRLHGQAGGQIVKGGDFRTPAGDLRSAARLEFAPVDEKGERRSDATGFRLVLVPPSLPSIERLAEVRQAWTALPLSAVAPQDDPVKEAEVLAQSVEHPELRKRIAALSAAIKASIQARNEQRDRAAVNAIRVGAYIAGKLAADRRILAVRENLLKLAEAGTPAHRERAAGLEAAREAFGDNADYYLDVVLSVAADYPPEVVAAQAQVLQRELEERGAAALARRVDPFVRHVERARAGGGLDRDAVLAEIGTLPEGAE